MTSGSNEAASPPRRRPRMRGWTAIVVVVLGVAGLASLLVNSGCEVRRAVAPGPRTNVDLIQLPISAGVRHMALGRWIGPIDVEVPPPDGAGSAVMEVFELNIVDVLAGDMDLSGRTAVVDWISYAGDEQGGRLCEGDDVMVMLGGYPGEGFDWSINQAGIVNDGDDVQFLPVGQGAWWDRELDLARTALDLDSDLGALEALAREVIDEPAATPGLDAIAASYLGPKKRAEQMWRAADPRHRHLQDDVAPKSLLKELPKLSIGYSATAAARSNGDGLSLVLRTPLGVSYAGSLDLGSVVDRIYVAPRQSIEVVIAREGDGFDGEVIATISEEVWGQENGLSFTVGFAEGVYTVTDIASVNKTSLASFASR